MCWTLSIGSEDTTYSMNDELLQIASWHFRGPDVSELTTESTCLMLMRSKLLRYHQASWWQCSSCRICKQLGSIGQHRLISLSHLTRWSSTRSHFRDHCPGPTSSFVLKVKVSHHCDATPSEPQITLGYISSLTLRPLDRPCIISYITLSTLLNEYSSQNQEYSVRAGRIHIGVS